MTVVITMAGIGSRFVRAGYDVPKYRIGARGRSLFDWSMLSLSGFADQRFVFAALTGCDREWILSRTRAMGIHDAIVVERPAMSRGQAETAYDVLGDVAADEAIWIYNIDTFVAAGMSPADMSGADGCLHVFDSSDPGMSFVAYDAAGDVRAIAEKKVISNWATVGMYGFGSARLYAEVYRQAYVGGAVTLVGGERYVAPMYELMLAGGSRIVAPRLRAEDVHILGTPDQVLDFDAAALPPAGGPVAEE